jgi:hypothetical protein
MAHMQPITLFGHWGAPNPWKVIIILKELDLPYNLHQIELSETKQPPLTEINPNGRLPAIKDPNTGIKLWEVSCCSWCYRASRSNSGSEWCHNRVPYQSIRHET